MHSIPRYTLVWGACYTLGAHYLSKNTVIICKNGNNSALPYKKWCNTDFILSSQLLWKKFKYEHPPPETMFGITTNPPMNCKEQSPS